MNSFLLTRISGCWKKFIISENSKHFYHNVEIDDKAIKIAVNEAERENADDGSDMVTIQNEFGIEEAEEAAKNCVVTELNIKKQHETFLILGQIEDLDNLKMMRSLNDRPSIYT